LLGNKVLELRVIRVFDIDKSLFANFLGRSLKLKRQKALWRLGYYRK